MDSEQQHNVVDTTPDTPGSILRRCREFQNISIVDASEATKIGKNYLKALEDDRPQDFPNPAYLKGFLKIYATHLGLNPDDLLKMLEQTATASAHEEQAARSEERIGGRRRLWQRLVLPAFLLAAIAVTALFFMPSDKQQQVRTTSPLPPPVTLVQQPHSSTQPPLQQPSAAPGTPVAQVTPPSNPPAHGVLVRLKVLKNSQITITIDEATSQPYELTTGDLIEWKADRVIALDLSDSSAVELDLNGKPLKPAAAQPGKPLSLILDVNGVRK